MAPLLPAPAIFDREALLHRVMGDEDLVAEILQLFHESAGPFLQEVGKAGAAHDPHAAASAAHAIRGSAATVSALRVAQAAEMIETQARAGQLDDFPAQFQALRNAVAEFQESVTGAIRGHA